PDLSELVPLRETLREDDRGDQLAGLQRVLLRAREELVPGHQPAARGRGNLDGGVHGGEEGMPVTGRAGRSEVAADGGGVADLWGADRAGGLGVRPRPVALHPAPGDAGADAASLP